MVAGAAFGFLPLNARSRPLVFLGDVGSYSLGAALAGGALLVWRSGATFEAAVAPLLLYITDTVYTVIDRRRRGLDVLAAHRDHVYQRLTPPGTSHMPVMFLTGLITFLLCALGVATLDSGAVVRLAASSAMIALLVGYIALPGIAIGNRLSSRVGRMTLKDVLLADLARQWRANGVDAQPQSTRHLLLALTNQRFLPVVLCRVTSTFWRHGWSPLAKLVSITNQVVFGVEMALRSEIGPGLYFPHTVGGIVLGAERIGANATIYHGVTLGAAVLDVAFTPGSRPDGR